MLLEISQFAETVTEVALPCSKCNGSGYLQQHKRLSGGVCFKCDGNGKSNKTRSVVKETEHVYGATVTEMTEADTFDSMFADYEARQAKIASPDFNIFDWFENA